MLVLFTGIVSLIIIVLTYFKWSYQYWKNKGMVYAEPAIPYGSFQDRALKQRHPAEVLQAAYGEYRKNNLKHIGYYRLLSPMYMPLDLELIKNIMAKDFAHFVDRGIFYNEKDDPLSAHLFAIGGVKWRNLRVKLTPTFTTGKIKMMFPTLIACGKVFKNMMDVKSEQNEPINIKDELGRFTTDIIGSVAFGLEINSINEKDSSFRKYGTNIVGSSRLDSFKLILGSMYPTLGRLLGFKVTPKETSEFFLNVVKNTVEYREKNNYTRNDFMQILIDLKNNKFDHEITDEHDGKSLTFEELAAQCFVFFVAGFETSSTVMTFALLEMCLNEEIQEKARKEVNTILDKYNGDITYDAVMEMKYLSQVIDESLRLYPPVPILFRKCVKDYRVPGTDILLEAGTRTNIPIYAIQRDKEYFPNPDKFDPDNFTEERKKSRHPYAYIPFGEGPRNCIGMRFGLMQSKVGLAIMLKNYRLRLDEKTQVPIKFDPKKFIFTVDGGVWLRAEKIVS